MTAAHAHASTSTEHSLAEALIIKAVSELKGKELLPGRIEVSPGVRIQPDGVDADRTIFVEAYARQGKLVGAQLKKVAQDVLKFTLLKTTYPTAEFVLAFASAEAMDSVRGWLLEAVRANGVEMLLTQISDEDVAGLLLAQDRMRQGMKQTKADLPLETEA